MLRPQCGNTIGAVARELDLTASARAHWVTRAQSRRGPECRLPAARTWPFPNRLGPPMLHRAGAPGETG